MNPAGACEHQQTVFDARMIPAIIGAAELGDPQSAFVGDHANDLAAARAAGLAIAFNPKSQELVAAAQVVLRGPDLRAILEHL